MNPGAILKAGDVLIDFKSYDSNDPHYELNYYGTQSYYRNGEWLFTVDHGIGWRDVTFGPNYFIYTQEFERNLMNVLPDVIEAIGGYITGSRIKIK